MRGLWAIYKKELYSFWASPIFYIVALVFSLLSGYFFYSSMAYYNVISFQVVQNPLLAKDINILTVVIRPLFFDMSIVLLILSPLLTMKLFAEEKKTGTIELILTYPITDIALVFGKFLAVLTIFAVLLLLGTLLSIAVLIYIAKPSLKVLLGCYLGILLMGASFLSIGLFTSSLTQNQIIAATLSFGALLGFWVVSWMRSIFYSDLGRLFEYISITYHFDPFTKGLIDIRHIIYYLAFTAFFIFVTIRQIELHRWRG